MTKRHLSRDAAEDVVAEAVRKVLSALLHGSGPRTGFRPYLFTAVRTVTLTQAVSRHGTLDEHVPEEDGHETTADSDATIDAAIDVMTAFASLPTTWRRVLWATAALDLSPDQAAALLRTSPSAVAMMATRARAALRIAFVRQHLPASSVATCQRALDLLARRSVVVLARSKTLFLDRHLASCLTCQRADQQIRREFGERKRPPNAGQSA